MRSPLFFSGSGDILLSIRQGDTPMMDRRTNGSDEIRQGDILHGFRILRMTHLPELRATACEAEHLSTGAQVLHLFCDDRENLFSIGFRTPPGDSTGVPHILEHSVLAGSERYPVKDAFNELHRGTLQTFINAFTYPDKTIYPVASQVRADYFNLARVYADLVLNPRLLRETFLQEGHHLEFADPTDRGSELRISGIVFNEMKGAYSSPDNVIYKTIQENLFPDTVYRWDSGGAPEEIPSLTYERFQAFHRSFYSPSNARFFLYGDIPTKDHLRFLEELLAGRGKVEMDSRIRDQIRWDSPRSVRECYPADPSESIEKKTTVNLTWMLCKNTEHETALLLEILAGILVGSAAGPLRKALIDSGLGQDLSPVTGVERDLKQIVFSAGLRGSDPPKTSRIEALILETLRRCAEDGYDRDLIEGTLHQVEFAGKEIVRSAYPYGIVLMGRAYHSWLYDGDPLANLNFPRLIESVRERWGETPRLFEEATKRWLIDNPHRLLSVVEPCTTLQAEREAAFRKKMAALKSGMTEKDLERIAGEAAALKRFQAEPDPPEAIASLPRIGRSDLSRDMETIPTSRETIAGATAFVHEIFTNGIVYLDLAFDVSEIGEEFQPYLPLLGKLMTSMGAAGLSYEQMAKRIQLQTGGIGCHLAAGYSLNGERTWQKMIFQLRALERNLPEALKILTDILLASDFSDDARMRDLLAEKKNGLRAAVIPSGHAFARRTAAAGLSLPARRDEQWHGLSQLRLIAGLHDDFETAGNDLPARLVRLRSQVLRRDKLTINLTAAQTGLDTLQNFAAEWMAGFPAGATPPPASADPIAPLPRGVAIPADVSYAAKVFRGPTYGSPLAAPMMVLARHLSNGYLYKRIRVQGGAYGGLSSFDPGTGTFAFLSYRDPHIVETLDVYREAEGYACSAVVSPEEMDKVVIGTIGAFDKPMDPAGRGYVAMIREFIGLTDESRRKFRSEILGMTSEDLLAAAQRFFEKETGNVAVYASEERLKKANERLEGELRIEPLLMRE